MRVEIEGDMLTVGRCGERERTAAPDSSKFRGVHSTTILAERSLQEQLNRWNPIVFLTLVYPLVPVVQRRNQRGVQRTKTARADARKSAAPDIRMAEAPLDELRRGSSAKGEEGGEGEGPHEVGLVEVAPAATDESEPVATAPTPLEMTAVPLAVVAPVELMARALKSAKDYARNHAGVVSFRVFDAFQGQRKRTLLPVSTALIEPTMPALQWAPCLQKNPGSEVSDGVRSEKDDRGTHKAESRR